MTSKKAKIKGVNSNYKIKGEGDPVLILHGWGGSSCSWAAVQEILSKKYKVICPDFPGFGESEIPPIPWTVSDYADWTKKFVDYLGLDSFYLVSHSFGGRVAIKFGAQYPEKLRKMVLCGPAGIKMKKTLKNQFISFLAEAGNAVFSWKVLKIFKNVSRSFFYLFLRRNDYVNAKGPMRETMSNVLEEDLFSYLNQIKTKTLIIWGEEDKFVPVKLAYVFQNNIRNSELKILPKNGHSPHLGIPEKVSELIDQFICSR